MRYLLAPIIAVAVASPASAQLYLGTASAVSGDTLEMGGQVIRLAGIDAPVPAQSCQRDGAEWRCGAEAKAALTAAIASQPVECKQQAIDALGRIVADCRAGRTDLADMMLRRGLAVSSDASRDLPSQAAARATAQGMWAGTFEMPAVYRVRDREWLAYEAGLKRARQSIRTAGTPARAAMSYGGCGEVWARLNRPIYRGEPGYREDMDGDGDGVACELPRR